MISFEMFGEIKMAGADLQRVKNRNAGVELQQQSL